MTKIYTGWEAIKALKEGMILKREGLNHFYKIENNILYTKLNEDRGWESQAYADNKEPFPADTLINAKFSKVLNDDSSRLIKLADIKESITNECLLLKVSFEQTKAETALFNFPFPAGSSDIGYGWFSALRTFMRLKSHRLAVRTKHNKSQYFIMCCDGDIDEDGHMADSFYLSIISTFHLSSKMDLITPAFSCLSDAQLAISDIGEKNILDMFKTFHGIN